MCAYRLFFSKVVSGATIFTLSLLSILTIGGCSTGDRAERYPVFKFDYTAGEISDITIDHDGQTRRFLYYVPKDFNPGAGVWQKWGE